MDEDQEKKIVVCSSCRQKGIYLQDWVSCTHKPEMTGPFYSSQKGSILDLTQLREQGRNKKYAQIGDEL